MKLICKQLRLSDTWFQTGFVTVFLIGMNAFYFLSNKNVNDNLHWILVIDAFLVMFMYTNQRTSMTPQNDIRLTNTFFGIIPWWFKTIPRDSLLHVAVRRDANGASWPNCLTDLYWTAKSRHGTVVTKSSTILQRRQDLGASVAEAKSVAKSIGIKFVDDTNKKLKSTNSNSHLEEPYF